MEIEVLKQRSSLSEGARLLAAIWLNSCVGSSWSKLVGLRKRMHILGMSMPGAIGAEWRGS